MATTSSRCFAQLIRSLIRLARLIFSVCEAA
jgi:hypothetical protein